MRLFIGIELPEEILDELLKVQKQLRSQAKRGRFVVRENFHLTLQFLGEVPAQAINPIVQALHKAGQGHNNFSLALKNVGSFGNGNSFRVIWAGIDGDKQRLTRLQTAISLSLADLGFQREQRPYHPHITLGRDVEFRQEVCLEKHDRVMAQLPFLVSRFSLIASTVENGKRSYRPLYSFSLDSGVKSNPFSL